MLIATVGQMTSNFGVFGKTMTSKWQPAVGVPSEPRTLQTTVLVPSGKLDPEGGEQTMEELAGQLVTTGSG